MDVANARHSKSASLERVKLAGRGRYEFGPPQLNISTRIRDDAGRSPVRQIRSRSSLNPCCSIIPSGTRLIEGPAAVNECLQVIPCNPREMACPSMVIAVGNRILYVLHSDVGNCAE